MEGTHLGQMGPRGRKSHLAMLVESMMSYIGVCYVVNLYMYITFF